MSTWAALQDAGLVSGERPAADDSRSPWFVRLLVGFGGWMGALFLLGWVGAVLVWAFDSAVGSFVTGAVICAGAVLLFRSVRGDNTFLTSFGLAVSLSGQALMVFGIGRGLEPQMGLVAGAVAVQQAALFFLVPHGLHRVWCAATAAAALAFAMIDARLAAYALPLQFAALAWLWLKEFDAGRLSAAWRAAAYGLTMSALLLVAHWDTGLLHKLLDRPDVGGEWARWIGLGLTAGVLVWAGVTLLAREGVPLGSPTAYGALLLIAILAAASLKAPGIAVTVTVLVAGFANGNRLLAALGIAALLAYLSHYYYSLDATLLEKSMLLATAGAALLGARLVLRRLSHA